MRSWEDNKSTSVLQQARSAECRRKSLGRARGEGGNGRSKPSRDAGAALSNWAVREWVLRKDS